MYFVYVITSMSYPYICVGITSNLDKRISQYNNGKERTTRHYAPFKLIYTELHPDRSAARLAEKYYKSGTGKEFLKSLS